MSTLVTLAQAKTNLRITSTSDDADIQFKLNLAEALVLEYIGYNSFEEILMLRAGSPVYHGSPLGSPIGSPVTTTQIDSAIDGAKAETLQAAILLVVSSLYDNRLDNPITPAVESLLRRWRDPQIG